MKLKVRINSFNVLRNEFECTILESDSPNNRESGTILIDPYCSHVVNDDEPKANFIGKEFIIEAYPYSVIVTKMIGSEFHRERQL